MKAGRGYKTKGHKAD